MVAARARAPIIGLRYGLLRYFAGRHRRCDRRSALGRLEGDLSGRDPARLLPERGLVPPRLLPVVRTHVEGVAHRDGPDPHPHGMELRGGQRQRRFCRVRFQKTRTLFSPCSSSRAASATGFRRTGQSDKLDGHFQRPRNAQRFGTAVQFRQQDQPVRVLEVLVEQREISPRRVVGDVADGWVGTRRCTFLRQFSGRSLIFSVFE